MLRAQHLHPHELIRQRGLWTPWWLESSITSSKTRWRPSIAIRRKWKLLRGLCTQWWLEMWCRSKLCLSLCLCNTSLVFDRPLFCMLIYLVAHATLYLRVCSLIGLLYICHHLLCIWSSLDCFQLLQYLGLQFSWFLMPLTLPSSTYSLVERF